jgi:hypothetical protein
MYERRNDYLRRRRDRKLHNRGDYNMDGRNPYGSRGGYVDSRSRGRDYDMAMDHRDYGSEYRGGYDSRRDYNSYGSDGHRGYEQRREPSRSMEREARPMQYEIYGYGGMKPKDYRSDYRGDYNDYNDYRGDYRDYRDYRGDYGGYDGSGDYSSDKEYQEDLEKWTQKLQKKDKFRLPKQEVLNKARTMKASFDGYSEEEFYTVYLMIVSDNLDEITEPHLAIAMAKKWLEDDDIAVSPSEKLCIYMYEIVMGEK